MKRIVFYLTIILSFPLLIAGENSYKKSKEEAEYYRKLNLARAYERGTVLKKDERKAFFIIQKLRQIGIIQSRKHWNIWIRKQKRGIHMPSGVMEDTTLMMSVGRMISKRLFTGSQKLPRKTCLFL